MFFPLLLRSATILRFERLAKGKENGRPVARQGSPCTRSILGLQFLDIRPLSEDSLLLFLLFLWMCLCVDVLYRVFLVQTQSKFLDPVGHCVFVHGLIDQC